MGKSCVQPVSICRVQSVDVLPHLPHMHDAYRVVRRLILNFIHGYHRNVPSQFTYLSTAIIGRPPDEVGVLCTVSTAPITTTTTYINREGSTK